jgi:hypothetical protein
MRELNPLGIAFEGLGDLPPEDADLPVAAGFSLRQEEAQAEA